MFSDHPNVKGYFGHGGLLGLSEGVYVGLPMILMPMFGDQFHNCAAVKTRGAAVVIEYNNLSEQTLRRAVDEIFNNTRYVSALCFNLKMGNPFYTLPQYVYIIFL